MQIELKQGEHLDDLELNGLRIIQNENMYRFTTDSVLLSNFARLRRGDRVADLCTGSGVVAVLLSAKTEAEHITAVDISEGFVDMARRSVELNGLTSKITVQKGDIAGDCGIACGSLDAVVCNPPYGRATQAEGGYSEEELAARFETRLSLPQLLASAAKMLKHGGKIFMVHRVDRLADVMCEMRTAKLEPKRIRFVVSKRGAQPLSFLIEGRKGGSSGMTAESELVICNDDGSYTDEARTIYSIPAQRQNPKPQEKIQPALYVVATPIGNLEEITFRAIETLKNVDAIAAEDTRRTAVLLCRYGIDTPMISYHKHNEKERCDNLLSRIAAGESVALVSDAGMPLISDPGYTIVSEARRRGIEVYAVSGACALVNALAVSGLPCDRFAFVGFLPEKQKDRQELLAQYKNLPDTLIFYCAPHDIKKTVQFLHAELGARQASAARELTKIHEEVLQFCLDDASRLPERGEYVLLVEGAKQQNPLLKLSAEQHCQHYLDMGMPKPEAIKQTAKERGVPKNQIYSLFNK